MKPYTYNAKYQQAFSNVINDAVREFPRTLALRVDLRFPSYYQYGDSNKEITRFIESLKAKIDVACRNKNHDWDRNWHNRLRYIWVREIGELNQRKHYHALLLLNKDFYWSAGDFKSTTSLAGLIQQAWCSALGIELAQYKGLVNFTENGLHVLNTNKEDYSQRLVSLLHCMDYLAKDHTKSYHDGYRSIGMSRG
ncbi:inovirus Gp2 family protein [Providencia rettgeri]|uniref:inovirus Gp2 family protein n=1 Tax=Providencia rettgeri TaxID=587 RepID=UPI001980F7C7|nr:inovirus Gp2 family protein [Providencia rettgeri]MBN6350244.1 inovirus Gp2 family protein [Providencia rettgeri]